FVLSQDQTLQENSISSFETADICCQVVRITLMCRVKTHPRSPSVEAPDHRVRTATPFAHIDYQRAFRQAQPLKFRGSLESYPADTASSRGIVTSDLAQPPRQLPCGTRYGNSAGASLYHPRDRYARALQKPSIERIPGAERPPLEPETRILTLP